jgi:malonyl-CoA/methylmalonyl-CoA synthetase
MVWLNRFDEAAVLEGLSGATVMMGVPTFYTRLLAHPGLTREATAHMRLFISGSAPLLESAFEAFEARTGHRILERYGMSEAVIITTNPLEGERKPGSVGFPLPGVDLRIGGGEETGVIEIRGPSVFSGYWRMPEKTAEEFTADAFFITGDVGRRDPDGRLWISGRAKDLIISGGYNVYPKEVELVLDEQPGAVARRGQHQRDLPQSIEGQLGLGRACGGGALDQQQGQREQGPGLRAARGRRP